MASINGKCNVCDKPTGDHDTCVDEMCASHNGFSTQPAAANITLVEYVCGCVGFLPDDKGDAMLLYTCDTDDNGPTVRHMLEHPQGRLYHVKPYRPVSAPHWQRLIYEAFNKQATFKEAERAMGVIRHAFFGRYV